jgi:hypothetical protein
MNETQATLSPRQIIVWWERRRLLFNALLLAIGVLSVVGFVFVMDKVQPPGNDGQESFGLIVGVLAYAFVANVCYTMGWVNELRERKLAPDHARSNARFLYKAGMWFSCLLTTAPFWYACLFYFISRGNHSH